MIVVCLIHVYWCYLLDLTRWSFALSMPFVWNGYSGSAGASLQVTDSLVLASSSVDSSALLWLHASPRLLSVTSEQLGPLRCKLYCGVLLYSGRAGLRLQMRLTHLDRLVDCGCPTRSLNCSSCRGDAGFREPRAHPHLRVALQPPGSPQEAQSLPSRFDVRSSPIPFTSVCLSDIVVS